MELASHAGLEAANFIVGAARPAVKEWDHKGRNDFATYVDRQAEEIIAEILQGAEPGSQIMGEELTPETGESELTWIVDPLDGTTNYLHSFPVFAVSIAAVLDGEIVAGVVRDVNRGTTYRAFTGGGAWADETQLTVSENRDPTLSLIGTGFPFKIPEKLQEYSEQLTRVLKSTSGVRRAGAAAIDLAYVAAGIFDGFWEMYLAPWDVAAGALLVREAGGTITNLDGSSDVAQHGSIVAGNPDIHKWLRGFLAEGQTSIPTD